MRTIFLLCCALTVWGCGGGDGGGGGDGAGGSAGPANTLTVAAFNVGMARGYVDHAAERFEPIIEAVAGLEDVDVLCLQELWSDDDITPFLEGVGETFPESYMYRTRLTDFPVEEGAEPPCTMEEIVPLVECSVPLCDGNDDLTTCVLTNCGEQFNALSAECQGCAAGNIGLGNVPEIVEVCTSGTGDRYSYDGHNGLMILSKTPITNIDFAVMPSFLTVRGILYGEVGGVGIACSHLTPTLEEPVYSGEYDSYDAENAAHVDQIIAFVDDKRADLPAIIAGDFNAGPAVGDTITGDLADNFAKFGAAGWADVSIDSGAPLCTWCADNPLSDSGIADTMLDHIMVKNVDAGGYARIFDGRLDVPIEDGSMANICLSDHYGLRATLTWE